ncbi:MULTISPECIES: hypothetical protein [unclassified Pseudofrankia]|uniref:hypothetical protein n=1 Tax=unclassified Pseudofrankia TaxID=2994372 RepID=UPI0012FF7F41|nr:MULTISPECIES: hypothetical protein [unclassified Pseudofrankia]MDT3445414.1 hypothetical protein [Pseudofrankia sp. BMG5.37]
MTVSTRGGLVGPARLLTNDATVPTRLVTPTTPGLFQVADAARAGANVVRTDREDRP